MSSRDRRGNARLDTFTHAHDADIQRVTRGPAPAPPVSRWRSSSSNQHGRAVSASHLVALVRAGAAFRNGKLIEQPDESEGGDQQEPDQETGFL